MADQHKPDVDMLLLVNGCHGGKSGYIPIPDRQEVARYVRRLEKALELERRENEMLSKLVMAGANRTGESIA